MLLVKVNSTHYTNLAQRANVPLDISIGIVSRFITYNVQCIRIDPRSTGLGQISILFAKDGG